MLPCLRVCAHRFGGVDAIRRPLHTFMSAATILRAAAIHRPFTVTCIHERGGDSATVRSIQILTVKSKIKTQNQFSFCPMFSFLRILIFISPNINFHFAEYSFSFRQMFIFISPNINFHFAKYQFSFRPFSFCPASMSKLAISKPVSILLET